MKLEKSHDPAAERHLRRWLGAEAAGRRRPAEVALRRVFRQLPRPRPAAGFADRVLSAAGIEEITRQATAAPQVAWRVPRAWALAAATVLAVLAGFGQALSGWTSHSGILSLAVEGALGIARLLGRLSVVVDLALHVQRALWVAMGSPEVVSACLLAALVSALSLRALAVLVDGTRRGAGYV